MSSSGSELKERQRAKRRGRSSLLDSAKDYSVPLGLILTY